MNIYHLFQRHAEANPGEIAFISGKGRWTYQQMDREIQLLAAQYHQKGIRAGDRVLVFVPMSYKLYRLLLALFYLGAVPVFIDGWAGWKRLNRCCDIARCKAFAASWQIRLVALFSSAVRRIPIKIGASYRSGAAAIPPVSVREDHPAIITFTTGSTGAPKAAVRSHHFLDIQQQILNEIIRPDPGDIVMSNLPILVFVNLASGCTTYLADISEKKMAKADFSRLIDELNKHRVSRLILSPFLLDQLMSASEKSNKKPETVKKVFTGGGPVFPGQAAFIERILKPCEFKVVYGSTEAEPISIVDGGILASSAIDHGLLAGDIHKGISVRIIRSTNRPLYWEDVEILEEGPDAVGEIIVAGAHVLDTYLNNETAYQFVKIRDPEGRIWHRTGDSGFMENGRLYLCGRCSSLICFEGRLIKPFIVENALKCLAGIENGTVLLHKDILVFIIEKNRLYDESLTRSIISGWGFMRFDIMITDKMPKDPRHHTKIDYARLRLWLESGRMKK